MSFDQCVPCFWVLICNIESHISANYVSTEYCDNGSGEIGFDRTKLMLVAVDIATNPSKAGQDDEYVRFNLTFLLEQGFEKTRLLLHHFISFT